MESIQINLMLCLLLDLGVEPFLVDQRNEWMSLEVLRFELEG